MTANRYARVEGQKFEGTGQALLVWNCLENGALAVKDIVPMLDANPAFKTRQTTLRIAAYYICVFNKAGLVSAVATPVVTTEIPVMQHD